MSHATIDAAHPAAATAPSPRPAGPGPASTPAAAAPGRWASPAAWAAIGAPAGFFTVMTVLGLVRSGYDWVARYASELSIGHLGWIMIANFITFGVAELALAAVLARTITQQVSGRVAAAAAAVTGAAFVVLGICVTDPARLVTGAHTVHGTIHELMAVVVFFLATPAGALATARRFRGQRGYARYCIATAVATPLLLIATFASGPLLGLTERITIAVIMAWLTSLAVQAHRLARA